MALILKDRVKEGTTTTGTGDITLAGAGSTFSTFQSHMSDGDTTYYAIVHTTSGTDEWEVGIGTWNTGNTFSRNTIIDGSNGTSAVDFSSGTKNIFMTAPADKSVYKDASGNLAAVSLSNFDTDDLAEGSNLYFTTARIDAHLSGGTGVTYSSGAISIGQAVGTSDNVTFNNITSTGTVTLAGDPTSALQAATKEYVDTIAAAGIHYHTPVRVEAPSNLNATYDNGTAGVGATLTNAGTNAAITIDGIALSSADRVLVYNQTNAAHNGIYTVTTVGDGSTAWVLTRATDADSYGSSDKDALGEGDAFFVKEGATGAGELYVMNTSGTITFGTTAITFTVIAETAVYSAGDSLTLTGTTFDTVQDIRTTASPTFAGVTAPLTGNVTGNVTGDITGNVTGNLTGNVTGNADTATALATARTIQLSGDVTGSVSFDGTGDVNITATVGDDTHAHIIDNVDGLQAALDAKADDSTTFTAGNYLTGGGTLGANRTFDVDATSANTASKVVARDASGNFSAGTITATLSGNASTATSAAALTTARTISLTGDVSGSTSFDGSGNVSITATVADDSHNHITSNIDGLAEYIADTVGAMVSTNTESGITVTYDDTDNTLDFDVNDPTITLTGDVTGSATMTNLGNVSITTTVADDSHNHVISNVDGLQTALDGKSSTSHNHTLDSLSNTTITSNTSGEILKWNGSAWVNNTLAEAGIQPSGSYLTGNQTITLTGDVSGSGTTSISVTVADDSHNHVISNVDGLQTALDGKASTSHTHGKLESSYAGTYASADSAMPSTIRSFSHDLGNGPNDGHLLSMTWGSTTTYGAQIWIDTDPTGDMAVRQRNNVGTWTGWYDIWTSGNDGSGSGLDADLLDGYHLSTTRDAANTVPVRDGNGYLNLGWINTTSGATTGTINKIYASYDDYLRYITPATFRSQVTDGYYLGASSKAADSNLLDGIDSGSFARVDATSNFVSSYNTGYGAQAGTLTAYGATGATMSFHRPGYYAINMGLDSDNVFRIGGWSAASNRLQMDMSGNLTMAGNVTAYSDERLKSNIKTIEGAVDTVKALRGVTFEKDGKDGLGVIAQEVQKVLPELVHESGEYLSVAYGNMVGLLIEAIKEQQQQIDELKAKLGDK